MSRTTLMLYVAHHLLGYRFLQPLGWVTGHTWRGEYGVFTISLIWVVI
jgi:hypothetical protein